MEDVLIMLAVFLFSFLAGHLLISKIPPLLHTPLMSMTNAISAVTILGAFVLFATQLTVVEKALAAAALALASFNLVGGIAITDRMLRLFREKD